ncbi:MAG TPA: S-methyl-5-thioribose-1-phosphate isomerase [Rhodocyclaceae bacterium]|nr:S-methyl-5-thioribose-1-phosphate isomerase [Rhodocyclaceae bacterium]
MTYRTIVDDGNAVIILDQTLLPDTVVERRLVTLEDTVNAISVMQVRGAPLIGVSAAYGVALGLQLSGDDATLEHALATLAATRPTAVNLHWALDRMRRVLAPLPAVARSNAAWSEARAIAAENAATNAAIGRHGLPLLKVRSVHLSPNGAMTNERQPINIMTHCNAGWLATTAHGTALAPIYAAHAKGIKVHVWVSETRPRNQGRLTAWELADAGVPHTLIADNAAGLLMMQGKVDLVIVGADRIAANGDTANKIGTYLKALAAQANSVPFYVAAPRSTIDFVCSDGAGIPIEERNTAELDAGDTPVANPAFDVTPAALIDGIITESGVFAPDALEAIRP